MLSTLMCNGLTTNPRQRLSTDTVLELLAHRFRRELIFCLRTYEEPLAVADVADEIAIATNGGTPLTEIDPETVAEIYMELYHTHIPRLADHGVVAYDQDRDLVALSENADQLNPYLELATEMGHRDSST